MDSLNKQSYRLVIKPMKYGLIRRGIIISLAVHPTVHPPNPAASPRHKQLGSRSLNSLVDPLNLPICKEVATPAMGPGTPGW
jgi:hypothetical protein